MLAVGERMPSRLDHLLRMARLALCAVVVVSDFWQVLAAADANLSSVEAVAGFQVASGSSTSVSFLAAAAGPTAREDIAASVLTGAITSEDERPAPARALALSCSVSFYPECYYQGRAVTLTCNGACQADHARLALNAAWRDHEVSSVQLSSGCSATLFEYGDFTGRRVTIGSSVQCLDQFDFNDLMSSLKIATYECVPQKVLRCINDYSSFWPTCSPNQKKNKSIVGPDGYEFGHYCSDEWADALNEVLKDPEVSKCKDKEAIHRLLAQVAYETGYFSTLYQLADGGAGLIHMTPANWRTNTQDMDELWPGQSYAQQAARMGKDFFQSAHFGWRSAVAWFLRTNRVVRGCGSDLFWETYETQTRCMLGRGANRSEVYSVVGKCMALA